MNRNVYFLAFCQAMMMCGASMMVTVSALIGSELAVNKAYATLPIFFQFLFMMLTSIPASLMMAKWGRKSCFLSAAFIGAFAGLLALFSVLNHSFVGFCIAAAMIGCFSGFGNYFRFAAADISTAELKSKAISYVMAGGVAAAFIGPNIANWSKDIFAGEPYAGGFLFLMAFFLLMFIALLLTTLPNPTANLSEKGQRTLAEIAAQPKFIVAVICGMLGYSLMTFVMTATPLAMKHHSFGLPDTSFVIQWHVLAMFLPSFFTGQLIDRFGIVKILLMGALAAMVCVTLNLLGQTIWHFWAALIFLGISWNFLFVGGTRLLTETYTEAEKAKSQACNDFMVFSLVSVASLSAGFLHHAVGWQPINIGVMPLIAVILVSVLWLSRVQKKV